MLWDPGLNPMFCFVLRSMFYVYPISYIEDIFFFISQGVK